MGSPSFGVALLGRNSRCKGLFLKAASSSASPMPDTTRQVETWWTPGFAPRQADLIQTPAHGFSPSGERLLSAQLSHVSVADVVGDGSKDGDDGSERYPAILVIVSADMVFHKGQPRPSRGGSNAVKDAVFRTRERLGGAHIPFAVAVSVDVDDEPGGKLVLSSVKTFIRSMKDELAVDGVPVVAVSPRTELWLREQESEGGRVSYRRGDDHFRIPPAFEPLMDKNDITRARAAFDIAGGTGVMAAISAAIALNPPTLVFPVGDFATLQSAGWGGDGAPAARLRTCRLLRASSSARDVFAVEKKEGILSGELIRADVLAASPGASAQAEPLSLELDAPISEGAWVLRLETNRRDAQVWKVAATAAPGGKAGKPLASVQFGDLRSKERRRGKPS